MEGFVRDQVVIDFADGVVYGWDQCNVDGPQRFPTVTFCLLDTYGLGSIADRIRKDLGLKPFHAIDEINEEDCDQEGWYEFSISLNGFSKSHVDSAIEFIVINSSDEDEGSYAIDLTEEEQRVIYNSLNQQCLAYLKKGCENLLKEAENLM